MKHLTLLLFTFTFNLHLLFAAVPLRWTVETSRLQPVAFDAVRGESLALEATFNSYGKPLALPSNAALFYQTNGMDSAWWSVPATVTSNRISAVFAPTNDPGASVVMGFLGSTGEIYRAAFTLRFRRGPGATPNAIEPPVRTLDFATITVLNPPWSPGGGGGVDTNAVKDIVESYGYAQTNFVESSSATTLASSKTYTDTAVAPITAFLDGSNVVFSITNYISGTYRLDAAKLKILELTNGVYREVYNSRDEIALHETYFETNTLFAATNAIMTEANAKIAAVDFSAWGRYTSDGTLLSEIDISNTVYMTAPRTVFAGGTEWERVTVGQGAIAVLTSHGAAAYSAGDAGTFHFTDFSSTNYFGWTKRSDFMIGCDTDAIRVTRVGQNNTVTLYYSNVVSSTYPIMLYRPTLENFASNTWEQLNYEDGSAVEGASYAVEWATGTESFVALISIPTNQPCGFFMAQTAVTGEAEFSTNMKADFKGGIVTTDGAHIIKPVYADGDLTWRTFDYGSGLQVSTPSQSQVTSTAKSVSTRAVARALTTDEGTVPNVYDFQNGTNFTLQIYTALTNIIKTLGGTVTNAPTFN